MTEHEHSQHPADNALLFIFPAIALVTAIMLNEANSRVRFLHIPDSVLLFVFSLITSLILHVFIPSKILKESIQPYSWRDMNTDHVLNVLLPPLIFESSFKINSHMFYSKFKLILSLTCFIYFSTLASTALILTPIMYVTERWYISMSLIIGSIFAATDPVAVVSILEELGAPVRLRILVESESLLNDGLALMAYQVFKDLLMLETEGESIDYVKHVKAFFMSIFVCPFLGLVFAKCTIWISNKTTIALAKKQAMLVFIVYAVFVVSGYVGSSILALVFFGVSMSYDKEQLSPLFVATAGELWHSLAYWADATIFVFAGYATASVMFTKPEVTSKMVAYIRIEETHLWSIASGFLLGVVPLVTRTFSVYLFKMINVCSSPIRSSYCLLMGYAGLRGALSLILAIELSDGLPEYNQWIGRQILIATSTSVCYCLIAQATTYAFFTKKEGATKRSKYMKDTEQKLQIFLARKVEETMASLKQLTFYLSGTKWGIVKECVVQSMCEGYEEEHHGEETQNLSREIFHEESVSSLTEAQQLQEIVDAKCAFYNHLLAKVHNSWSQGALSGNTAQVMIELLEHGIDEGRLVLADFVECVSDQEINSIFYFFYRILDRLMYWIDTPNSWFILISQLSPNNLYDIRPPNNTLRFHVDRTLEKGFLTMTALHCLYTIVYAEVVLDPNSDVWALPVILYGFLLSLTSIYENVQHCKTNWDRYKIAKKGPQKGVTMMSPTHYRKRMIVNAVMLGVFAASLILPALLLHDGRCIDDRKLDNNYSNCMYFSFFLFGILVMMCAYKISRATLMLLLVVYEKMAEHTMSADRVRLSVLHYLDHLSFDSKVPRDLFSPSAMRTVIKEQHHFTMCVEAVFRREFKKSVELMNVLPVIKTRQAIRMAAYEMELMANQLKSEGLVHGELTHVIEGRIEKLRNIPGKLLWAPQLDFSEWLACSRWFQKVPNMHKEKLIQELSKRFNEGGSTETVPAGTKILLKGKDIAFVKSGLIHVSEWLVKRNDLMTHMSHEDYCMQGDFLGIRNLMIAGLQLKKLPLKWAKTAYETRTVCDIIRIDANVIGGMLMNMYKHDTLQGACTIHATLGKEEQLRRCAIELRELPKAYPNISLDSFENFFARGGRLISSKEIINVKEGHLLILGCWCELIRVRPQTALTPELHIEGPAEVTVMPTDKRIDGLLMQIKLQTVAGGVAQHPPLEQLQWDVFSHSQSTKRHELSGSQRSNISINAPVKSDKSPPIRIRKTQIDNTQNITK